MQICIVSIFPEMVETVAEYGVVRRAIECGLLSLGCMDPRDFTDDTRRTVDDRPYGGGPGMVMKFEPVAAAIREAGRTLPAECPVIGLTPQGEIFNQTVAERFARLSGFILLTGRYEGIDERLIESEVDEELSLGDFVLSGGEIAAMAVIDAVVRLIPGVLGDEHSALQDSFASGLLDYPHYTRPKEIEGRRVPSVLLSGDHAEIARWRHKQALGRSYIRRPDLVRKLNLDDEQQKLLDEFLKEQRSGTTNGQSAGQ
jgi:tRNA (guanine37-N1)-methyltransferase